MTSMAYSESSQERAVFEYLIKIAKGMSFFLLVDQDMQLVSS